jgi:flagellar assembly protein FliH
MTTEVHKRFEFGTVFGDDGGVVSRPAPREKRFYTPEEVEDIRRKALKEGEASVEARAQMLRAEAVASLATSSREGLGLLMELTQMHKAGCVALALACARKIAAEAMDQFPEASLRAALAALEAEIDTAARLIITLPEADEDLQAAANEAAAISGFSGNLIFRVAAGRPRGAFEIQWPDGRADYDPDRVAAAIEQVLKETLAADVVHAGHKPEMSDPDSGSDAEES